MINRQAKDLKAKVTKQKAYYEMKGKDLLIHSIKAYASGKTYDDVVTVKANELTKAKKLKKSDVKSFRNMFYSLCRPEGLAIDSQSEKQNFCGHARARQHCFNNIAKAIDRPDLEVNYGSKKVKTVKKVKASKKAKAKKS